mgnify:CR=1 FL=1
MGYIKRCIHLTLAVAGATRTRKGTRVQGMYYSTRLLTDLTSVHPERDSTRAQQAAFVVDAHKAAVGTTCSSSEGLRPQSKASIIEIDGRLDQKNLS